jgi:hypothetical protein
MYAEAGHDIILQNKEYENLSCKAECKAEERCYMQGFNDALRLVLNAKQR